MESAPARWGQLEPSFPVVLGADSAQQLEDQIRTMGARNLAQTQGAGTERPVRSRSLRPPSGQDHLRTGSFCILGAPRELTPCYHDRMSRKTTTVRLPEDLADELDVVARGRGVSVNSVVIDALAAEIERVKADKEFMAHLHRVTERDKEILDRLAQ